MRARAVIATTMLLVGCSEDRNSSPLMIPEPPVAVPAPAAARDGKVTLGRAEESASAAEGLVDAARQLAPASTSRDATPAMIIRAGTASVEVDSLEPALGALRLAATRAGGYVANTMLTGGREQLRQATIELKIPAARFDDLLADLRPLGRLETVHVTAQDVGEEFVDLTARAANARRLEERLIDLLGTRTGKLQDVLTVERELARVREEIERYEGRLRWLQSRSALSSLSVTVHEPLPIVGDYPGSGVLARAFEQAWRNFVALLAGVIASLGVVVPLVLAGTALALGVRRLRRPPTGSPAD